MLTGRARIQIFLHKHTHVIIIDIISNTKRYLASKIFVSKLSNEDIKLSTKKGIKTHRRNVESFMKISAIRIK